MLCFFSLGLFNVRTGTVRYGTVRMKFVTLTKDNRSIILEDLRHLERLTKDSVRSSLAVCVIV